jgi:radical SAM protein with 4Fe4S-binding SPASM domain
MGFNKNNQGMMPSESFKSLIDDVGRFTALAVLYNSGEPLLHPGALEMIRHLTGNRVASIISTNGHFVKTVKEAEDLVASGLSIMVVSLSGASQKVYAHYHRGGRLDQVISGVRYVREARKNLRKKTPFIVFRFLIMDHNLHETDAMAALAEKEGCDWFEFREVNWRACLTDGPPASPDHEKQSTGRKTSRRCLWPWLISVIDWNGDIYPCCFFRLNLPVMGNAFETGGMKAAWKNRTYNRFRKKIRTGTDCPTACRGCLAETGFQTRFSGQKRTVYLSAQKNCDNKAKT